jgi:hypothetical protein
MEPKTRTDHPENQGRGQDQGGTPSARPRLPHGRLCSRAVPTAAVIAIKIIHLPVETAKTNIVCNRLC